MDFKKFVGEAGTFLNRAKQYTEEKFGGVEKTELDAHFENLMQKADHTKVWTEKILAACEGVLQPNPTARVESYFYEKLDRKKRDRQTNTEVLGQHMIDAGNDFGPGTPYGSALVRCGATEQKLAGVEKEFFNSAANNYLQPLKAFLDGDMKTIQKEKKTLENKRLDLDAAKTRLRRAKSFQSKDTAEAELRIAQSEFDRQAEMTKLLLEGISSSHAHHLRCLHDFIEAQASYYAQCHQHMAELQRSLGSFSYRSLNQPDANAANGTSASYSGDPPPYTPASLSSLPSAPSPSEAGRTGRKARVLYDYDAANRSELSVMADEIITIYDIPGQLDWVLGERGSQQGKIPVAYLQPLK